MAGCPSINFSGIPAPLTPVDEFNHLFSGVSFLSGGTWYADSVGNDAYEFIRGQAISTESSSPLTIDFDNQVTSVAFDLGVGGINIGGPGPTLTIRVTGFFQGSMVFVEDLVTEPGQCPQAPEDQCAEEAQFARSDQIDSVTVVKVDGPIIALILDNLEYCEGPVALEQATWGRVKASYRR